MPDLKLSPPQKAAIQILKKDKALLVHNFPPLSRTDRVWELLNHKAEKVYIHNGTAHFLIDEGYVVRLGQAGPRGETFILAQKEMDLFFK